MACSDTEEPSRVSITGPAAVIILAAGEGTRMKNHTPKVLNEVCGRTMLGHVVAAARELAPERLIVVTGQGGDQVTEHLAEHVPEAEIVVQERRGGTGHAVRTVIEAVGLIHGTVVVTYADTPLLRGQTLRELTAAHDAHGAAVTVLTASLTNPTRYARIIRQPDGAVTRIVLEADPSPPQPATTSPNPALITCHSRLP